MTSKPQSEAKPSYLTIWDHEFPPTRLHLQRTLECAGIVKQQIEYISSPRRGRFFLLLVDPSLEEPSGEFCDGEAEALQAIEAINQAVRARGGSLPILRTGCAPALHEAIDKMIAAEGVTAQRHKYDAGPGGSLA